MFYEDGDGIPAGSGLRYDPFKAIIAPRPIGWIGTLSANGVPNLGPYSFFNALSSRPNIVAFSSQSLKHSAANARRTGEFTFSLATEALKHEMNTSSATLDEDVNEFERAGLEAGASRLIAAPFVKASPAALECRVISAEALVDLAGRELDWFLVVGQVVAVHLDDDYVVDGRFDAQRAQAIARCGYNNYATADTLWELGRPDNPMPV
ncbi:flavin reductase family protein [Acuticoccus sp.]|uniref:flavin reductase family protein n=1 Tax=Acuticoccus sp. TaxID=1904378 RepID=UPI003B527158